MATRESFIHAICAAPDDDAVRLVFADWLEENGEPDWARFIRLSCEAARHQDFDERGQQLLSERSDLYWKIKDRRFAELRVFKGIEWCACDSAEQRGLFEAARVSSPKTLVAEADRIFSRTCLRFLYLLNPTLDSLAAVLALPHMKCLHTLGVTGPAALDDDAVKLIVQSPHLIGLRMLNIGGRHSRLTRRSAGVLAKSALLERLTCLDLRDNDNLDPSSAPVRNLQKKCAGRCDLLLSKPKRSN